MKQLTVFLCLLFSIGLVQSQNISGVINSYIEVTAFNQVESSVDVVSSAGVNVEDSLILIQMQGAQISTSQVDTSNGSVTNYNGAGSWEKVHVCSISGNTILFKKELKHTYSSDGAMQLIPINVYNNAVITDTITCDPWNGTTGGVVLIYNQGVLDFQSSIDVTNKGFRAGQHFESSTSCSWSVSLMSYEYDVSGGFGAEKGEGIAKYGNLRGGRGPLANGGGGGNDHNSGGGGGSNVSGGGIGGENDDPGTFTCKGYYPGLPGRGLSTNNERLFMGGGGGAGHSNSMWSSSGGQGAGIVIIISDEIEGNSESILGIGMNAPEAHGDGAGGGGAGGSVCLLVDQVNSALSIDLHGGNGGDMDASIAANTARCFGPGGGGGGGSIRYKTSTAPANVSTVLNGGSSGIVVNSTAGCNGFNINAGSGATGIIEFDGEIPEGRKCNAYCSTVHQVDLGTDVNTCDTDSTVLDAQNPGLNYLWSNGATTQTIDVYGAGQYWVEVLDGFCLACDTVDVQNFSKPTYNGEVYFELCDGVTIVLDAQNPGATYQWNIGATSQSIAVNSGGLYDVLITKDNCYTGVFFDVFECFSPPNTITPNGDGFNDTWQIENIQNFENNKVEIFNRRGQKIFSMTNYDNSFKGDQFPAGVYYYHLDLNNGRDAIVGTLTIVR